ncbi:hypothetical protein F382_13040 [Mannheimia haemolytica D153]|nr:hypothetical protein F382_13040 [Mannheimia haemolytica D153]
MGTFGYSMLTVVGALGMIVILPATFLTLVLLNWLKHGKSWGFPCFVFKGI